MSRKRDARDKASVGDTPGPDESQRMDKWLWFARVVRTRVAAAELAASGHVRVNGQRASSAAKAVRPGDVLTIALDQTVRVLKIVDTAERRGQYDSARQLYEDLTPSSERDAGEQRREARAAWSLARGSQRR